MQNLQIRSKVAAILLVPLAAVIVLSSIGIGSSLNRAVKASRAQNVSEFAVTLTALVHELQKERSLAAAYVSSGRGAGYNQLNAQWAKVDHLVDQFQVDRRGLQLSGYNPRLSQRLRTVVSELPKLDAQRQSINQSPDISAAGTLNLYDSIIQDILDVNGEIAVSGGNERLLRTTSALVALSRMKNAVDLQRAYLNVVFSAGHFDSDELQYQQFTRYVEAEDLWNAQFESFATGSQRNLLATTVVGPSVDKAKALRDVAINGETSRRLGVDPDEWSTVMGDKLNLLRQVERKLSGNVIGAVSDSKRSAERQALFVGIGLLVVLLVTVFMSLAIARSMVRPLRQLRRVATEVAEERLPRVVEGLQQAPDLDRVAVDEVSPAPVGSNDEIGEVASAFNTVHQVALRVATEQAALRKSIGDMFLNLARRSQGLLDRQLELIDRMERDETNPDALENLLKLDHLATRMRRNAEDLIVLSGAETPRRWSQPVPLVDVVRTALAEVEDYQRVELLPIDDIAVAGHAVSDVVHALAEIIENAISFSPPGTKVQVAGQPVSNGYVLEIEDRGLGMSDEELVEANQRLANPPAIDFGLSRMMGLYVVGRLAQRYGIRVQLRHSWYGGVTALMLLPPSITIRSQVPETSPGVGIRRPALPPPRSNGNNGGGVQRGDHLPIFEQARSDWFDESDASQSPLRRGQPADAAAGTGNGNRNGAAVAAGQHDDVEAEDFETGPPLEAETLHPGSESADAIDAINSVEPAEPFEEADLSGEPEPPGPQPHDAFEVTQAFDMDQVFQEAEEFEEPGVERPEPSAFEESRGGWPEPPAPEAPPLPSRFSFTPPGSPLPRRQRAHRQYGPIPDRTAPPDPGAPEQPARRVPEAPERPAPSEPGPRRPAAAEPLPPLRPGQPAGASRFADGSDSPLAPPPFRQPAQPRPWQPAQPWAPRQGEEIAVPLPEPTLQPASVQTTRAGLPRRVPRANLAPGIVAETQRAEQAGSPPPASSFSRSPDEVRSMLSSYRTGLERGRRMAAGNDLSDRGEDARSGYGGPNPMAPRSDDDAAQ
jgi:signal transduction histidine kinase